MEDARPEIFYQVGVTPENTETALLAHDQAIQEQVSRMPDDDQPVWPSLPDPKWRFFWRIGERPDESETEFADLNAPPVVPRAFAGEWESTMDSWGSLLLTACTTVAEMLAIGKLATVSWAAIAHFAGCLHHLMLRYFKSRHWLSCRVWRRPRCIHIADALGSTSASSHRI